MSPEARRPWLPLAAVAALSAFLWWHFQYPFYFIWDMDHTVLVDTVLIQSGKWPVHLHHPGFGLYLPLKWSHLVSCLLGFTSIFNLADLDRSVGPVLGVAELTDYLRIHSPFVALGIVLVLWRALTLQFRLSWAKELGLFLLLAVQASLFYHSTMIRTELYAVLWWSLAVYSFARSVSATEPMLEARWLMAGGAFLSLCLLTKIQGIIYLAGAGALLALFRASGAAASTANAWVSPRLRKISAANLAFATFLLVGAAARRPYGATFTNSYNINFMGVAFLIANIVLFLSAWGYLPGLFRRVPKALGELLSLSTVVMSGFLLAFLLHFAMYANPGTSYRYLLLDAKMVFFRNSIGASLEPWGYFLNLWGFIVRHPALFAVSVLFFGAFLLRRPQKRVVLALGAVFAMAFFSAFYGSRNYLRDLLWAETLVLLPLLWLAAALWTVGRKGMRLFVSAGLAAVLVSSCFSIARLRSDIDANYNLYGWGGDRVFSGTYFEGHLQFAPALHLRYGPEKSKERAAAFRQAISYSQVRRTASFVLANATVDMKALGMASKGQPVFAAEPKLRIESLPPELEGGVLVDPRALPLDEIRFYRPKSVNANDENLTKRSGDGTPGAYSLLPREDLEIFVVTSSAQALPADQFEAVGAVRLNGEGAGIDLRAWKLKSYARPTRESLGERHFIVIGMRLGG